MRKKTSLAFFIGICIVVTLTLFVPAGVSSSAAASQAASVAPSTSSSDSASLEARVDALFKPWSGLDTPGAAVAIVKDGMVVYRKGFGSAQLEYGIPITPSTVFHVASVSKQFTAMTITMLEAEGKLSTADDVRKYLPDLPDFGTPITIDHFLHHISGMRDQWELLIMSGWPLENVITQEHILDILKHQRDLNFPPGKQYLYCNSGFTLLAEIAAKAGGKPFTELTQEKIFRPLGMTSTHFHLDPREIVRNRAYSYDGDAKTGFRQSLLNYANVGATSLFTTVEDMANWLRNFDEKRVGGAAVIERLLAKGKLSDGTEIPYARGISWGEYRGLKTIGHGGADAGFRSAVTYFPGERFGVAVFSNLGSFGPGEIVLRIADIYLADKLAPAPAAGTGKFARPEIKMSPKELAAFAGTYWIETTKLLRKVVLEKDKLFYVRSNENRSEMVPVSRTEFQLKDIPAEAIVSFTEKTGARFDMITVTVSGQPTVVGKWTEPYAPAGDALKELIGRYESAELGTRYELVVKPEGLWIRLGHGDEAPLEPAIKDFFSIGGDQDIRVQFLRAADGTVKAMTVTTGRAWNGKFDRAK